MGSALLAVFPLENDVSPTVSAVGGVGVGQSLGVFTAVIE